MPMTALKINLSFFEPKIGKKFTINRPLNQVVTRLGPTLSIAFEDHSMRIRLILKQNLYNN